MRHQFRTLPIGLVAVLVLAACGGDDGERASAPIDTDSATPAGPVTSEAEAATPTEPALSSPATEALTDETRQEVQVGDLPSGIPTEPCELLTPEEVATVLEGADAGVPAVSPAAAVCEWTDASDMTTLELQIFDTMGEDMSAITPEMLQEMRGSTSLEPLDLGRTAIGGPEDDDAVVTWIDTNGLYQLRLWAIGSAPRPGEEWASLAQPMQDLATAVIARAGA